MQAVQEVAGCFEFGRFRVLPRRRQLLAGGAPVELGARAFDVLMALLEGRGSLVTKDELLDRVWPGIVVEENNIQVQISTLRKALGEDRNLILTVPLRGYRFTAEVRATNCEADADASAATDFTTSESQRSAVTDLPAVGSDFIGRVPDGPGGWGAAAVAGPPRASPNPPGPRSLLNRPEGDNEENLGLSPAPRPG